MLMHLSAVLQAAQDSCGHRRHVLTSACLTSIQVIGQKRQHKQSRLCWRASLTLVYILTVSLTLVRNQSLPMLQHIQKGWRGCQ